MTKKILSALCLCIITLNSICIAAAPATSKKVILFYKVPDAVIQCQNSSEDMISGAKELENELVNHYSKRFVVQGIKRIPYDDNMFLIPECFKELKPNQAPFLIKITLEGQGTRTTYYQNAFGAQTVGIAPATNVHLVEATLNTNKDGFLLYDYGTQSYSAGTFAMGRNIFVAQSDPRKNAKNAIRGCFRDACKFDESINKYANPFAYEKEYDRFVGNFSPSPLIAVKNVRTEAEENERLEQLNTWRNAEIAKIEAFKVWCNADDSRNIYLTALDKENSVELKIDYINLLIENGTYKE